MIRKLLITLTVMLGTIGVGWASVKAADTALELRTTTVANMPEMRAERAIVADWSGFTENVTATGDVYTITTPGQLAWIAAQVNQEPSNSFTGKTVKLGADIDLAGHNWNPIGKDKKHPFLGTFDGGNKSIKNMIVNIDVHAQENVFAYGGLFGIVKGEAAIKNVSIVSGRVTVKADKEAYAGALIAFTMDETNPFKGNISNCHSSIPVSSEITTTTTGYSNAFAGGLVGNLGNDAKGNNSTCLATVTNCSTSGSVTAKAGLVATNGVLAGGIAGRMQSSNILNCNTSGAIMSEGGSTPHAGGLVGHVSYTSTIKNCYSTSNVSSTSMNTSDAYSIVGGISGTLSKDSKVENCYATGALSAGLPATIGIWTISQVWAGGIVGYTMNTGSGISNCAALNASITISGNAAIQETAKSACRILGQNNGQSSLSGNLAYIGTTVTKWGVIMPPASTATSTDGATLKQSDLAKLFTSDNGWTSTETNLPTLTNNGTQTNIPLSGYSFNTAKNGGELEALLADALIGEIKLIAGTYTGNFIMKDGVNVTGAVDNAGKPASILDGDAKGRVLSYGADLKYDGAKIAGTAFTKETAISNLVIRNGATAHGASGAMICDKITLTNCEITGNKAPALSTSKGGGVMCDYGGVIDKCIIHDNTATDGGGGVVLNGGGLIRNSDVYANHADNDHSGGINTRKGGTIENCKVYGNTAEGLAGVSLNENAKMVNTLVYGNITGATAIDAYKSAVGMASSATMLNCTVWGNTHTNAQTGGQAVSTAGTITNCIMESHSGTGTITNSASGSELTTGTGNLSKANPKFTDAANNDYTLQPASACINKGTNTGVTAKTDLAGNTRIQGGTVDMGAYESNAAIIPNNEGIVYVTATGAGLNNGNSPTNAISPALLASAIANTNVTTLQFAAGNYTLSDTIVVARATKLTFAAAKDADGKYVTGVTLKPATDYAGRAIRVAQGANLQIDGLTISDFKTAASGSGIYNDGTLVLNEVTMSGNVSDKNKVEPVYGAAIFNRANLTVNGGTFSANKTPNLIYNDSAQPGVRSLTIKGCRFFDNTAEYMVYSEGVSTEIAFCVFDGNKRTGASPAGNSGLIKVGRSVASGTDFPVTNTPAVLTSNTFISAGATTGTNNPAVLNDNGNITLTKNIFVNAEANWVALANTTTGTGITRTWRGAMNVFSTVDKTSINIEANKNVFDKTITNVAFEDRTNKKYNLQSTSVACTAPFSATDYAGAFAPLAGDVVVATGTIYLSAKGAGTKDGSSEANAAPLTKFKTAADKTEVTKIILMEDIALTSAELAIARTSGSLTIEAAKPEITVTAAAGQSAFTISNGSMVTMKGFTIAGAIKSDGQLTLTDCTFDGNYASEVITLGGASSSIERCIFKGTNNSSTSIISITGAGARITNSLFYGFGARSLATLGADATLTNNTFVTAGDVNAIVVTAGTATVVNNILIKGTGSKATISGKATVKNNAMIDDYTGGTNNVKVADLAAVGFVNTTTPDYRLLSTSPCVDKGAGVSASLDLAGNTRVQGGIPDMGAYEVAQITGTQTWNTKEYQNQSVIVRKGGKLTLTKNGTEFTAIADITVEDGGQVFTETTDAVTTTGLSHIHTFAAPGVWEAVSLPFGNGTSTYPMTSKNGWLAGTDKNQTKGTWAATVVENKATAPGTQAYFTADGAIYAGTGHILAAASTATTGTVTDTLSFTKTEKAAFAMTETAAQIAEEGKDNFCFFVNPTLHEITLTGYAYILEAKGKTFERVFAPTIKPFGCYIVTKAGFTLKSFALRTDVVTGNESIKATEGYFAYGIKGKVVIDSAEPVQVSIVNLAGAMIYNARVEGGQTMIDLPAGVYIVNGVSTIVR